MKTHPLIKICGIMTSEEISYINEAGVDFAGFVLFCEKSKRNRTIEQVRELLPLVSKSIQTVAVVVSPTPEQVRQIEKAGFDMIQIHGEFSEDVEKVIHLPVLKAFHVTDLSLYSSYQNCSKIVGYVFDAAAPGSGKAFDWNLVKNLPRDGKPFFLAGGLTAENVSDAIHTVHPDGVDVSSGVEYEGKAGKDPEKIFQFVKQVVKAQIHGNG